MSNHQSLPAKDGRDLFERETESAAPNPPRTLNSATWILAHCDGGARGNPGPAGYGALIQDSEGAVLGELSEFLGVRTNNYAEYSGLLGCLQFALDNDYRALRLISDSELMVKQIQGKYKVKSPDLKPLYEEARRRIARLDRFEISHALRHRNKDADRLANEAMDRGMKRQAPSSAERPVTASASAARSVWEPMSAPVASAQTMLRGFTRDGVVHLLGGSSLPDGVFVKVIPE